MRKLLCPLIAVALACSFAQTQTAVQCLVGGVWVPCSMAPQPQFAQAPVPNKSSGSVSSLAAPYGSPPTKGNTLIVVFANGNAANSTSPITDSYSLKWFKAAQVANGTAFETEIWYAPNTGGTGTETVTVTPGGTNASIAITIYEVPGLVYPAAGSSPTGGQSLDQVSSNAGTGATSPSVSITPIVPNEYVFVGFGLGTAAQTINVNAPYNNDSGQQNPTTPSGLYSFVSASLSKPDMTLSSPSATATAEPWAVAVASFKTLTVPVQGTMQGLGTAGTPTGGVVSVQGVSGSTAIPVAGNGGQALDASLGVSSGPSNGLAILGQYNLSAPSPATGQTVAVQLAPNGSLLVQPYRRSQVITQSTTITSGSVTTILNAQSSGIYADLTSLTISTTSVAPTGPFTVIISDGTKSYTFDLNSDNAVGENIINLNFNPPLPASSAATAWTQTNGSATLTTHTTVVAVKQASNF